jgi:Uma2 family endonuclease
MTTTQKLRRPAPGAPAPLPEWVERVYRFERPLTPDEFFEVDLPEPDDGGKQELVDGEVVEMPGVGGRHGEVAATLLYVLGAYVRARGARRLGRALPKSCYRLLLPDGRTPVRCPDVSFVGADALAAVGVPPAAALPKAYLPCVPALACEVLSDHDRKNPRGFRRKLEDYRAAGVPLVWVIDPDADTVDVHDHAAGPRRPRTLRRGDTLSGGGVLPGLAILLDELFDA